MREREREREIMFSEMVSLPFVSRKGFFGLFVE